MPPKAAVKEKPAAAPLPSGPSPPPGMDEALLMSGEWINHLPKRETPAPGIGAIPSLYPAGRSEFSWLYEQIALLSGGGLAESLTLAAEPAAHLMLQGRFGFYTDNTGTPTHEVSGNNLFIKDEGSGRERFRIKSIGEASITVQDESLANSGSVSHGLQIHLHSTGVNQAGSGLGTGVQVFISDDQDVDSEAGNFQVVWANPVTHTSYVDIVARLAGVGIHTGRFQWDGCILASATTGGYFSAPYLAASVDHGQVSFGNVLFDGAATNHFVGSANGTGLAGAFTAAFTGNPVDIQVGGTSVLKLSAAGALTAPTLNTNKVAGLTTPFTLNSVLVTYTTDANKTLSLAEFVNPYIDIQTDAVLTAQRDLVVPLGIGELFIVRNRNAQNIRVIGASGTGAVVPAGKIAILNGSGANIIFATAPVNPTTGA